MIVSDTNLISYLWLSKYNFEIAEKIFSKDPVWCVPLLWKSEFRSVISKYLRAKLITKNECLEVIKLAENHLKESQYAINSDNVIDLILASNCSAYDCEFVSLAQQLDVPLLTFDNKILTEFPEIAVHPEHFLKQ